MTNTESGGSPVVRRTVAAACVSIGAAATAAALLVTAGGAAASTGGASNKGDVWVDNVGQPPGPGHEQDPHLACQRINLWGNGLADASGTYTIDGWSPSGSQEQLYMHKWSYDKSAGGTQVLDVIPTQKLVDKATAAGDAPVNSQGLHFKLQFVQEPQKHKTFWVTCTASSPTPTPTPTPTTTEPTS